MTRTDFFAQIGPASPGIGSSTVAPNNDTDLVHPDGSVMIARSLEILAAGSVTFVGIDGQTDSRNVLAAWVPYLLPVAVRRVTVSGTTVPLGSIKAVW